VSRRTDRIAGELVAELARLLREDVTDPRVGLVTITRADVAPDLSHALVLWSALDVKDDPDRIEACQAGLDSAAAFLRRRLARALPLKRMPELRFRYDPSLVLGTRTLSVLASFAQRAEELARSEPKASEDDRAGEQRPEGGLEPDEAEESDGAQS
jgi:ribosome-binding factor A